jgi:hypothetical protein
VYVYVCIYIFTYLRIKIQRNVYTYIFIPYIPSVYYYLKDGTEILLFSLTTLLFVLSLPILSLSFLSFLIYLIFIILFCFIIPIILLPSVYYYLEDGTEILDGVAGLWCVNAGHKQVQF